ncbi:uncharacterized protein LOC130375311 isoform X1 [Gadus chalcogrammus]|uniref:uncharacterized protein LOC130375311 isoform X1 n=1 Tax=Gadus chalcogrammus TaxID=1042646 RepID=UPI0024C3F7A6|nr:uncharacterized protein LOC130375311 isoform X1 [Gadus chalcogrammus]
MVLWQLLRARGALQTTRDRNLGHGRVGGQAVPGSYNGPLGAYAPVHYAGDAAHGSVKSFSMGAINKMTMQDLNWRLASYMDEVQALEAANETLEMQINELLDRKSPSDLINLDRYLETVNLLHSQITEAQTAEAQTKLQLVSLVLVASDLSARLDAEQGMCAHLQANLRDLRLTGEQMWANTLPCLSCLASSLTQELTELQAQHPQDVQDLRAKASGEISIQLSCAESTKLSEQLEMFRDESLNTMIDKNQTQNNYWFNAQASMLTRNKEEAPSTSSSEVSQTEMNNLKMNKLMLEEELTKLQTQKILLEGSDLSITDGYSMQLAQLQQRADGLALQLSSVRQATSEQAEEYQALLHIKSGLEREIKDYTALLSDDRTLSSSFQTMTSAVPLNVQTSGTAFQSTAIVEHDRRIGAQTRTLWNGSELKAQESRVHMPTAIHLGPVDPTSDLQISVSPTTQTSIRPNQVRSAEDAPRKYSTSVTSIGTSGLLDRSLTSSENKIQSITKEILGTCTGSQEGESKIASLELKEQSILLESQVPSLQTPTENTVIVEPRGVQEFTGTTLDRQMTKQVTNTVTEIVIKNKNIQHTITKVPKPESHINSDCLTPTIPVIERLLEKEHDISPDLSITSCDMQISERSSSQSNVCQIDSVVLQAAITTGTANTDIVGEPTVVDINISEAKRVTSIERPTEEEIHVGTVQGNTLDISQKSKSVEITAVGNHLEKTIQENTDGDALGKAQASLDEALVSKEVDVRVRLESKTYSTEDTSDQIPGTVVKLQASTVTKVEDDRSHVGGNAEGVHPHSSVESKADDSFAPLLASAVRIKEEAEDVEQSAITSHGSSDDIASINHTPLSENNAIPAVIDEGPIIENREGAVELDNEVPQVQIIEFVEKTHHVKEIEKGLSTHCALVELKMDEPEQEEGKEIEKVDTTLHAIDNSLRSDLPKTIQQGDQVHTIVNVVFPNLDSETAVVVEVNPTHQKTVTLLIETDTGMSSVVSCEEGTKVNLSQTHPDLSLSPEDTELCLSLNKTVVCSSTTTPGVSEGKFVTARDSDSLLSRIDPHTTLSQKESGPVETNDAEIIDQNELDTCFSLVDCDVMTQNEFEICFSPIDTADMTQNELEMCLSPVNQDNLNENELEACMSPVDNSDIMSPNQYETCFSPVDNNDILSQNELEGCFSPDDNDILSPNESETCFSPVDNDILSPNRSEACLSPDANETGYINREECFSPSDDVCMSPTEERISNPVKRYLLTTKEDNQSLPFSGKLSLKEKDKASTASEPPKKGNRFRKVLSSGFKFLSKMDAGSREEANNRERSYRNRSIGGIGKDALSPVGSPPDNRSRKLSLGDREDTRFHSITRSSRSSSSNKSLDGQNDSTRMASGSSLTNERSHCFRSVPTRRASFSSSSSNTEAAVKNNRATSPGGRIFSGGSGEWKLYGGSVGRTSNAGSAPGSSVGSGGRLARSGSGDRISNATSSKVISSSRRYGSVGSSESKPVYSSASGRISGVVRQSGVPGGTRAPSPGAARKLGSSPGGSGGRLSSAFGGSRMSSGSAGKHSQSGSNDRLSGGQVLRVSSTAGQVRTNSMGGRVISSSDRPGSSVGSGIGSNKERISVCKRAALSISAAGRERSQEKHRSTQRMASAKSIQHWVTTGVGGTEGMDDQDDILNL